MGPDHGGRQSTYCPRLREGTRVFGKDGLTLLLHPPTGNWCVVAGVGGEIAALCDGSVSVAEIAAAVAKRYPVALAVAEKDAAAYVASLAERGLLEGPDASAGSSKAHRIRRKMSRVGGELAIHLTGRCNLRCRHCYARSGPDARLELPAEQVLDLLVAARGWMGSVVFSGGEPLLYPSWRHVVQHAAAVGPTKIVTNGTLLTSDDVTWLAERGVALQVSVDGASARTHDAVRGAGSFDVARRGLERLVEAGHGPRTMLTCTLSRVNLHEASALLDRALEWGVAGVHFVRITRHGRAADNWTELAPEVDRLADTYRELSERRWELRGRLRVTGCVGDFVEQSLFGQPVAEATGVMTGRATGSSADETRDDGDHHGGSLCPVERNLMVEHTGDLYPCILMSEPPWRLGRLGETGMSEVFAGEARRRAVQACRRRASLGDPCGSCDWRMRCQGACPGAVLWQTGSLQGGDGLCELRRELYLKTAFALATEALDHYAHAV